MNKFLQKCKVLFIHISSYLWLNCPRTFCEHSLLLLNSADNCSLFWRTCVTPLSKKAWERLRQNWHLTFLVNENKANQNNNNKKRSHRVSGLNLCRWEKKKAFFWMLNSLQPLPEHYENNHQHLVKASLFINSISWDFKERSGKNLINTPMYAATRETVSNTAEMRSNAAALS